LDRNRSPENLVRAHDAICHDIDCGLPGTR
jgi:hypothetical protein